MRFSAYLPEPRQPLAPRFAWDSPSDSSTSNRVGFTGISLRSTILVAPETPSSMNSCTIRQALCITVSHNTAHLGNCTPVQSVISWSPFHVGRKQIEMYRHARRYSWRLPNASSFPDSRNSKSAPTFGGFDEMGERLRSFARRPYGAGSQSFFLLTHLVNSCCPHSAKVA